MRKYIGDKDFYRKVILLVIPIIIQQGITSFVNLLDNVMVGALGTEAISAVSISNQIMTVFQLAVFGGLSAIAIFGAQFYGKGDMEGMRFSFRTKIWFFILLSILSIVLILLFGGNFISSFLQGESNGGDIALTYRSAVSYMNMILIGFIPFILSMVYAGTLRETGQTFVPMAASTTAILVNLLFNWLLIYGKLGFPKWGVYGAAVATTLSRFVELLILLIYMHTHTKRYTFMQGAYRSLYVPRELLERMIRTGLPLLVNEVLWSFGITMITQSYSVLGLNVVAAVNICNTAWNVFMIAMIAMGNAVQIIVGQHLGRGELEEAKDINRKLIFMTLILNLALGAVLYFCSDFIPLAYNVSSEIRALAASLLVIDAIILPIESVVHVCYFAIRSGGHTVITMLFDCVYTLAVPCTIAFFLCRFSGLSIVTIFAIVQFTNLIKMFIALILVRNGFWARKIV